MGCNIRYQCPGLCPCLRCLQGGDQCTHRLHCKSVRQGIRWNAVCSCFTLSASAQGGIADDALEILGRHTPTPYLGTPGHLAEVVTFLASPAAAYITGQIISVDGGLLSHHPQTHDQLVAAGA
nr:SDR family oxidoreductase [Arthrobacter sp. 135MFCol5.1]